MIKNFMNISFSHNKIFFFSVVGWSALQGDRLNDIVALKSQIGGWWKVRVLADLIYHRPPSDIKDVEMHYIEKRIIASRTKSQKRKKKMRIYILSFFSSKLFIAFNLFLFWPIILYCICICAYCWAINIWARYAPAVEAAIPL